jgi:hypothetical protein
MQESLHRAQANDAYWHGLFGGLYLPHLRRAIWNNLLALEADLDAVAPNSAVEEHHDIDSDGSLERVLHSATLKAYVREDCHAGLVELSSLSLAHNFGDTLQRYPEASHEKLGHQQTPSAESEGITSAHDRIAFRHEILPGDAEPDIRPRGLFLERLVAANGNSTGVENYHADSAPGVYIAQGKGWRLEKRYEVVGSTLTVTLRLSGKHLPAHLQTEINLAMPSCDGFGGRYLLPDGEVPCGFGQELKRPALAAVRLEDSELRGAVALAVSPAPTFLGRPHLTVSQSEAGFEKIMQATCLILSWPAIAGEYRITLTVEPAPAV